jgi:hypothetical protein
MKPLRYFQTAAIAFALALGNNATAFCQYPQNIPSRVQKVKDQVQKIGIDEDVTVILLAGKEYYGSITEIEPDSFKIAEVDLKQRMTFDYKDVKKVRKGYGRQNPFNGKRWNPRVGKIAVIALSAWLIILVVLAVPKT